MKVVHRPHRLAGEVQDHITGLEARAGRGPLALHFTDHDRRALATQPGDQPGVEHRGLPAEAQARPPYLAVAHDAGGDIHDGVGADREAEALGAADHGGVDADHPPPPVGERASGIARVQRGVGLHHALDQPAVRRAQGAAERADDAGGDRRLEAQWIADRDRELADS